MKFYNFVSKEDEIEELYIDGELVEQGWEREFLEGIFGEKATASNEFTDKLKELNGKPLKIHCNSQGGSLFAGTAIYCALANYKGKKTGYIDSMSASAATFPMLACDKTYMTSASAYCCHLPMVGFYVSGNRIDIQEQAEKTINDLKQIENVMIDAYQRKTKMGATEIRNLLERDEILNAKQAIAYGFVDGYVEDEPKFDTAFVENMFNRNVMVYNSLKPKMAQGEPKQPVIEEDIVDDIKQEREAKIKAIRTKFDFLKLKK